MSCWLHSFPLMIRQTQVLLAFEKGRSPAGVGKTAHVSSNCSVFSGIPWALCLFACCHWIDLYAHVFACTHSLEIKVSKHLFCRRGTKDSYWSWGWSSSFLVISSIQLSFTQSEIEKGRQKSLWSSLESHCCLIDLYLQFPALQWKKLKPRKSLIMLSCKEWVYLCQGRPNYLFCTQTTLPVSGYDRWNGWVRVYLEKVAHSLKSSSKI